METIRDIKYTDAAVNIPTSVICTHVRPFCFVMQRIERLMLLFKLITK